VYLIDMRSAVWFFSGLISCSALGQGIRGVTRRTPTVVYQQPPAQFFAAGGLRLVAPTNIAATPGVPNAGAGVAARGTLRSLPAAPTVARQQPTRQPAQIPAQTQVPPSGTSGAARTHVPAGGQRR
jgi:hypothetical protein